MRFPAIRNRSERIAPCLLKTSSDTVMLPWAFDEAAETRGRAWLGNGSERSDVGFGSTWTLLWNAQPSAIKWRSCKARGRDMRGSVRGIDCSGLSFPDIGRDGARRWSLFRPRLSCAGTDSEAAACASYQGFGAADEVVDRASMLISHMARDNVLWGAPRIHGELLMLGFNVSQVTVSRYIRRCVRPRSPAWRSYLRTQLFSNGLRRAIDEGGAITACREAGPGSAGANEVRPAKWMGDRWRQSDPLGGWLAGVQQVLAASTPRSIH